MFPEPNRVLAWIWSKVGHVFGDASYLKVRYRLIMGKKLNLKNPQTFNEKLQWLKLHNRRPEYTTMVDKYAVKDYVADIIGREFIIPTLGIWDSFDEIDFSSLPNEFVLKSTNGGGGSGVVICPDKNKFNIKKARQILRKSMNTDWKIQREWVYYDVKPRIIAEEYIHSQSADLRDYKFFCFNGNCWLFKIDFDRHTNHRANYFDKNLNLLPFGECVCPPKYDEIIDFPPNIEEMISLAEKISTGVPFLRVDLYNCDGAIYFGECTFFPNAGFGKFTNDLWDKKIGHLISLQE